MKCIPKEEWFIHEAGWHLLDGDMSITPHSRLEEPPLPAKLKDQVLMWHEVGWDIHLWIREEVPVISLFDDSLPDGGLRMVEEAFWYPVEGKE